MSLEGVKVWWFPTIRAWGTYCRGCGWAARIALEPGQHAFQSVPRVHDAAAVHVAEHRRRDPYAWTRYCEERGDDDGVNAAYAAANEAARERWRRAEPVWPS